MCQLHSKILRPPETLRIAHEKFQLSRSESEDFFLEWQQNLPELTDPEIAALQTLRKRYLYQRSLGSLLEGAVTLLLASPLLAIAGFYDPPFQVKMEPSIQLIIADGEETLQGRLDVLVLKGALWVVVVESKKTALSAWSALPQTLAYLMANPNPTQPSFAMMTNGDDVAFVKLMIQPTPQYDVSRVFSPFTSGRELQQSLQILKRITQLKQ